MPGVNNKKRVFILGAGFSRARGMPLIRDFSMAMRDALDWCVAQDRARERAAIEEVLDFRQRASGAGYRINIDLENIEELFSLASTGAPGVADSVKVAISATLHFRRATSATLPVHTNRALPASTHLRRRNLCDARKDGWQQVDLYSALVANLMEEREAGDVAFISFNYDTVLEDALTGLGMSYDYGFRRDDIGANHINRYAENAVGVYKLHGSVNWILDGTGKVELHPNYDGVYGMGAIPSLIPPTWNKTVGKTMLPVWNSAVATMADA
jgi:hypothetical protein